ncbi:MAG: hypothetical protein AB7G11_00415 [Phycisphaerales bacterium]
MSRFRPGWRVPRWVSARNSSWAVSIAMHVVVSAALAVSLWGLSSRPDRGTAPVVSFSQPAPSENRDSPVPPSPATAGIGPGATRAPLIEAERPSSVPEQIAIGAGGAELPALPSILDAARAPQDGVPVAAITSGLLSRPIGAAAGAEPEPVVQAESGGQVRFAGLGASQARRIVYVVDASGPMVTSLPNVIEEIKRSASHLTASQQFGVIVFRHRGDGAPKFDSFMPVLVRATPGARRRLSAWLQTVEPGGRSNPLDGLRAALAMDADAVFLLSRSIERTDGGVWQMERGAILSELDRLNPRGPGGRRRVTIKTIQFLADDPTGIMQAIGEAHGSAGGEDGAPESGYAVIRRQDELPEKE